METGMMGDVANFTNTLVPPTVRLGDTADPILTVSRNTASVEHQAELVRPLIERTPRPAGVILEFRRLVLVRRRRRAKRAPR
jgi:hypothetical protein